MKNTTTVERTSEREFTVTRTFDAPARLVFEAWTKPELLERWWAPKSMGMALLSCEADVRVGGTYRLVFDLGDSKTMAFFGKYLEVKQDAAGPARASSLEGSDRRRHRLRGGAARDVRAAGRAPRHARSLSMTETFEVRRSVRCSTAIRRPRGPVSPG